MAVIAAEAKAVAKADPELINRGVEGWMHQLAGRQDTRERIAIEILKVLAEEDLPQHATVPLEDFMRPFEDIAERVSSEEMVDLMARILAGEIRKPGSISRKTLAAVSIFDREVVAALAEVRPYLIQGESEWMHIPPSSRDVWRPRFRLLNSASIASESGIRMIRESGGFAALRIGSEAVVLGLKPSMGGWLVDGAHLTPIGQELISFLPIASESKANEIALGFREHNFVVSVGIGRVVENEKGFAVADTKDLIDRD